MFVGLLAFGCAYSIRAHEEKGFVAHMREHGLLYTAEEYHFRLGIYLNQVRYIREHNQGDHGFRVGLNQFSTWTHAEYESILGYRPADDVVLKEITPKLTGSVGAAPSEYSWADQGVVQSVKDQAQCGSCWTFGAIGAQESMWAIKQNKLYNLSEQNLLDCVTLALGCNGGNPTAAYLYVIAKQSGHFNQEVNYPYQAKQGTCRYSSADAVTTVKDVGVVTKSETSLLSALYQYGPACIAIDASKKSFNAYVGGIYNEPTCSSSKLDHAVLLVGWGVTPSEYWLVKNSWGVKWGELGYVRMTRNNNNQCGVASQAVIPFSTTI